MNVEGVEDIYVMTPLQQGLLFHSLLAPQDGLYIEQFVWDLQGDFRLNALESAWQQVANRHAILRTSFHWEDLGKPLQVVHREMPLFVEVCDWRGHSAAVQEDLLAAYLADDRQRGFNLAAPPLMRLAVAQAANDSYKFIWSFHHIILDGWSSSIVQAEVFALYQALSRGTELALAPVIPFSSYIAWLRRQDLAAAEAFWRRKLQGFTDPVALSFENVRQAGSLSGSWLETNSGQRQAASLSDKPDAPGQPDRLDQELRLSAELTAALQSLARRHHLTLNTLLLGAWGLLLSRYTGRQDIVVGVTVSGRPETIPGVESIVGNFINTLPARLHVSADPLINWLRQLQAAQLELHNYEYTPLADIQKWSDVAVGQPLFESIFVFENATPEFLQPVRERGSVHIGEPLHLFKTNYPLAVQVSPGEALAVRIEYDSRRFGTDTIARMLSHLETLLEAFVASPEKPISALSLLSAAEARQMVVEWNDSASAYPETATIHELFAAQARRTPNAVGLVFADEQMTFEELNARANRLAHYLRRCGVGPETRVGICMERCMEMVVGLLAILKSGGVCVPLDPSYPRERLAFMLRDTHAPLVLTQTRLAGRLPDQGAVLINPDACAEMLAQESADDPASATQADNLAYIIYTSGSTGTPKGVEICHRGIVRMLFGQQYVQLDDAQTTLHLSPSSFDGSFFEVWGALLHGGRCVLFPDQGLSVRELGRVIEKHGVSVLWLTASLFNAVVDEDPSVLAGVRQLLTGGEALSVTHVSRALEGLPGTQITNGYGPTENSTFTSCHRIPRPLAASCHSIPIGRPIANTQVYVLDDQFNPVPISVAGELYTSGDGLARGYSGQPELTAERFLPNPFSANPGARMYRTGDLTCYLPDGKLEFLRRRDQQIKLRGFRIEPGEIEAALRQHSQVLQAAAVVRTNGVDADRQLLAYVVTDGNGAPSAAELRGFLKERLPEYLIPAAFIAIESLPLTPNGKLDRRALADRELAAPTADVTQTAPSTPVKELLTNLCAAVLGVERVGISDDFFALGGHSLLAMRLVSRIRETFKIELPMRSIFEAPTVTGLAIEVEKMLGAEQSAPPIAPARASREGDVPLSFAQQRLWILDQFDPGLPAYNIPLAVLIQGRLHVAALADSLNEVVRRHEALRTSFATREGQPRQVVAPALNVPLPVIDLDGLPQTEREVEARRLITNEAMRRFDLARGPLLNALLLKLDAEEHIIVLTLHHIVADGWSLEVLLDEVATLYEGFQNGTAPALPELPIQYTDYAVWERERLQDEALERQFAYWRARLAGAPAGLELLTDRSRPAVQTFSGGRQDIQIPPQLYSALKALSRDERATLFMTLLAAFKTLLHRYTSAEDLLVGTVTANRNRGETERLIGFFANTLVLRTDFSGDPNFREVLGRVRATVLGAYAHQDLPFEKLVEELRPERNLSLSPLFQVLFTFRTAPPPLAFHGLTATLLEVETGTTKFDLSLALAEGEEGLSGVLEYNRDLFDEATMSRMLGHFSHLLESVVADSELPVARHSLLLPEEQKLLAGEWINNRADYPRDLCMHELFEAQAAATPAAVALACADEQWTYGELDARANQLANHLSRLGVRPEVVVGVCMERSAEMVIGLLAILKAGGAYLPLDPAYPKERLAFMLADVEARVLLTQEHLTGRLPSHQATTVFLNGDGATYAGESTHRPPRLASPNNLAYLIYTSGSTGRPKGVAIEHRNAVTLLHWARDVFSDVELSGLLAATSICFDISVFEIFAPLSWGGKVILVENVLDLLTLRHPEQVTLVDTVPSAMAELLRAHALPESVRTVNLAGEPIAVELIAKLYEQKNVERIYNFYGPSEDTTYSTYALARRGSLKPPPIGRPITNTQIYLLDKQMGLAPLGVAGEVYIGGEGLSRGYYGHSNSTAKLFLPNPFSDEPGARMYRTGDLARYLPDGELEFLGRADHQVKLRGFRIEMGEIETMLKAHAAVREALVLVREDAANDKRLVAYIVAKSESAPGNELQSFLRERLPEYMIPSAFVVLDALPLLPNGKINRGALPAPAGLRAESAEAYAPPRDELELAITAVWQEVLRTEQVGIHDNFFSELGGHSLLAIQAVARLREHLAPQLSFVAMFQFPTVSSLAGHLRSGGDWQPSSEQADERARQRQQALRQRRHFKQAHLPMGTE